MAPKPIYQKLNSEDVDDEEEQIETTVPAPTEQPIQSEPISEEGAVANTSTNNASIDSDAPPPYEPALGEDTNFVPTTPTSQEDLLNQSPPLYTEIVKLPTYNESQNIESDTDEPHGLNRIRFFFVSRGEQDQEITEENIGTDIGFILCFLMAFIFNGLGFLVAYCSTNTLSSHYGAFSGFGLSLVKWAFIVKHRNMLKEYFDGNDWILYCVVLLGWMIFLKGMFSYAQLKRTMVSRRRNSEEIVE